MITLAHADPEGTITGGGDLELNASGNIETVSDLESARQRVVQHLRWWRNEWFLNFPEGVPYRSEVLTRPISTALASAIIADEIRKVPDVLDVKNIEASINPQTRTMDWRANISTRFGETFVEVGI